MVYDILVHSINSVFVVSIGLFLAKASRKKVLADVQGAYILGMNKLYKYLGWACMIIAVVYGVLPFFVETDTALLVLAPIMILLFGGFGALSLLYYKNHYLLFTASFIEVRDFIGKTKSIAWKDLQSVTFNSFSGLLTLKSSKGIQLKIHQHLVGLKQFIDTLETKNGGPVKDLKLPF